MNEQSLEQLKIDEGFRSRAYHCTAGKLTIGYGYNMDANPLHLSSVEIAYAHTNGMPEIEAERLLKLMVAQCQKELEQHYYWFANLDEVRRGAVINMFYNLGYTRFSGFHNFIKSMEKGDYKKAALDGLDSEWHREDVPERSARLMVLIKAG